MPKGKCFLYINAIILCRKTTSFLHCDKKNVLALIKCRKWFNFIFNLFYRWNKCFFVFDSANIISKNGQNRQTNNSVMLIDHKPVGWSVILIGCDGCALMAEENKIQFASKLVEGSILQYQP